MGEEEKITMEIPESMHGQVANALAAEQIAASRRAYWVVILGLQPMRDGNQYCFLWGDNIQVGVAGFGDTPEEAIGAFEKAMNTKIDNELPKG
jgi:hypothetical protein